MLFLLCPECRVQSNAAPLFQSGGPSWAGCGGVAGGTHTPIPTLGCSPGSAGKCCLRLEAVVFWAGPLQASKAQPFLLKGSICSSLALWQRPPTKLNKGSGLASARASTISAAFFLENVSQVRFPSTSRLTQGEESRQRTPHEYLMSNSA